MLTNTLSNGLARYEIGPKVRALRLKKKLGLKELGGHTGLSPALLSKIECGRLFPTLPTLLRIALVFSVGLDYFFGPARDQPVRVVVRKADRQRFPDRPGAKAPAYHFECLDFPASERPMSSYYVEFAERASASGPPHQHAGVELVYVLRGRLAIDFGTDDEDGEVLDSGDSMYFDADRPHRYRRQSAKPCAAIVVTAV
jgi:transcriptional regulator with XRE-family HTH domain